MSPRLKVLPLNSTLSNVTIPRFDGDKNRVAYLKADLMEILADGPPVGEDQPRMVDCTGIQLLMQNAGETGEITVNMKRARYRLTPGVLTVKEDITAHSELFTLQGSSGVFHLDTQRGFVFGPLECDIFEKPEPEAMIPNPLTPGIALMAALTTPILAQAPEYRPLTKEQLFNLELLALPAANEVREGQKQLGSMLKQQQETTNQADQLLAQFAGEVESDSLNLLIQNPPKAANAANQPPEIKEPSYKITCDGGGFFDGNANLLVLLRNVVVTEERFTLRASKEIKVFFKDAEAKEEKPAEEGGEDEGPDVDIGEVKTLVATGGVNFSGVNKDGDPFEASAETASYNQETNQLILKDGRPTFRTVTPRGVMQMNSEDEDANVVITLMENTFSAQVSDTGWVFQGEEN
jgi:hypothetical protein